MSKAKNDDELSDDLTMTPEGLMAWMELMHRNASFGFLAHAPEMIKMAAQIRNWMDWIVCLDGVRHEQELRLTYLTLKNVELKKDVNEKARLNGMGASREARLKARVEELEKVCAQTYQVVGSMASDLGQFEHEKVIQALDNLSRMRLVHRVLPFPSFEKTLHETSKLMRMADAGNNFDGIMRMRICESHKCVLRLGQAYMFTEDPKCDSCRPLADAAREAYGPTSGAPCDKDEDDQ